MIIVDILFKSFHIYVKSYGERGIHAATIPFSISTACLLTFGTSYLLYALELNYSLIDLGIIGFAVFVMSAYFLTNFLATKRYTRLLNKFKYQGISKIYYLLGPIILFGSSFLLVLSFRYMN